jgi:hypothetical protein
MYQVSFQTHYDDRIDIGKVLVCAASNEQASEIVVFALGLPPSKTTVEVSRIKPSLFQLERREIEKDVPGPYHGIPGSALKQNGERPQRDPWERYALTVTSEMRAGSESHAWRKLGNALIARAASPKAMIEKSIVDLDMTCERAALSPRTAAIDLQSIYKERRIFSGGAARSR